MSNENLKMKRAMSFKKLPAEIQKKLVQLQKPDDTRFVFFKPLSIFNWLGVVFGIVWFIYLFSSTQNVLWEDWMFWFLMSVSIVAAAILSISLMNIAASKFARLKSGHIFTTDELIKIKGDGIEHWNLKELESFQYIEGEKAIETWIGDHQEKIKVTHSIDAEKLSGRFDELKRNSSNSFLSEHSKTESAFNPTTKFAGIAIVLLVAILFGTGLSFAAKFVNRSFDDKMTWENVLNLPSIEEYEKYLAKYPQGTYASEANQKIGEQLGKIKANYLANVKKGAIQNAVDVLGNVIDEAAKRPDRTIFVKITETRNLDEKVVEEMKNQKGLKIGSYYSAIPPTGVAARKDKILNDLRIAFLPLTKNGALKLEASENPPEKSPVMTIDYRIESAQMYYQSVRLIGGSFIESYYPGANFIFNYNLKPGNSEESFATEVSGLPSNLNTGVYNQKDDANYSFEKVYFGGISENFSKSIEQQFGIRE